MWCEQYFANDEVINPALVLENKSLDQYNVNPGEKETRGGSAQAGVHLLCLLRRGGQSVRAGGAQVQVCTLYSTHVHMFSTHVQYSCSGITTCRPASSATP